MIAGSIGKATLKRGQDSESVYNLKERHGTLDDSEGYVETDFLSREPLMIG